MTAHTLRVGISTCPNDTFAFHALMTHRVTCGLDLRFELMDIDELNIRMQEGSLDVAKASFHQGLLLGSSWWALPAGAALGFGVGPLLLSARGGILPEDDLGHRVLAPGERTTATLLYRLFHPAGPRPQYRIFSSIMPALRAGEADFGVCIHEGRFTYAESGLVRVEDLGQRWEERTGSPLPLGGIFARKDLAEDTLDDLTRGIRESLAYGIAHREETLPTMRRHAQELEESVMLAHVDTYVNDWTMDLGPSGRTALEALSRLGRESGLLPPDTAGLSIYAPAVTRNGLAPTRT